LENISFSDLDVVEIASVLLLALLLLLLLFLLLLAKDGFVFGGGEVNGEPVEFRLEVVAPLGPALKVESLLGRQVQASELDVPLLDLSRLASLEVVFGLVLVLQLALDGANLHPLPADADLVELSLDKVDGDSGVGKGVETAVDVHQTGGDLLPLDALLGLTVELFAVLGGNARALLAFGAGTLLVEHIGIGEVLVLLHEALARSLEVGGVFAVKVAAEAAAASVNELRSDDFSSEAVGDDLKKKAVSLTFNL
jgi:hypothetical protein